MVTKPAGGGFDLTAAVTPTGAGTVDVLAPKAVLLSPDGPVNTGETWTLALNGAHFPYAVQSGDDLSSLAAALASLADRSAGYTAGSEW